MLALDPNETFEVGLDGDADAIFVFRYLSAASFREATHFAEDPSRKERIDSDKVVEELFTRLAYKLVGWRGVSHKSECCADVPVDFDEFDLTELDTLLTIGEAWDLFWKSLAQGRVSGAEKNGSGSLSPTDSDGSAAAADASRDAGAGRTNDSPQSLSAPYAAGADDTPGPTMSAASAAGADKSA